MCTTSFACGGVKIHYPFYLSNTTQVTADYTSYTCGYTDLNVSCGRGEGEAWTPTIRLGGDGYTVKNIFYNNQTIILADSDVLGGGGCPSVRHNVSVGQGWQRNTSSYDNLTFFYGCYAAPRESDPLPRGFDTDKYQINCSGFSDPSGGGVSFVEIVIAPVRSQSLMASSQSMLMTKGGYGEVLKQGFELGWGGIRTDTCHACEQSGGRCSYSQNKDFLGCLCSDGMVGIQDCTSSGARPSTASASNIVASTSCLLLLCLIVLAFFLAYKYGLLPFRMKDEPRIQIFLQNNENLHPRRYSYAEANGRQVPVTMLKDTKGDGEEFMNEVASISRTSHVNVVTLLGFCLQGSKRALIYEYMSNGSLERYAFNSNINNENALSWEKLFDIAIGIARGLEYLHQGCSTRIVHFDIKPHNILLDQGLCRKISDFGLAKLCLNKDSAISIVGARGTIDYIAPEVFSKQFGTVSSKSDVYSYGMMVLEMVGARDRNISANTESSSQYFPQWLYEHLDEYCISGSEINGETTELVRKMIVVGLWCIQVIPTDRPTMTRVVEMLEGSTSSLELPPKVSLN
ncbi:hypothetical protein SETIT_5G254100v2 [Setaria italica]|uniref:Protein kinase domain-containing protein n=1 Tax=Setaria italica TaxID=4555 RepID=A0A368R8M9_SETIT|nr:hypothetical protein SETIT_5G254100v2 [Setaria italica]